MNVLIKPLTLHFGGLSGYTTMLRSKSPKFRVPHLPIFGSLGHTCHNFEEWRNISGKYLYGHQHQGPTSIVCKHKGNPLINSWTRHADISWFLKTCIFFMWVGFSKNRGLVCCRMWLKRSGKVYLDLRKWFVKENHGLVTPKKFLFPRTKVWLKVVWAFHVSAHMWKRVVPRLWKFMGIVWVLMPVVSTKMVEIGTYGSWPGPQTGPKDPDFRFFLPPRGKFWKFSKMDVRASYCPPT